MNQKATNPIVAYVIIAIVLIGAFTVPFVLSLVESSDVAPLGPVFATNAVATSGVLGIKFDLEDKVEISSAVLYIYMKPGSEFGAFCTLSMWIQNDVGQAFGTPIVDFPDTPFAYQGGAQKTISENALHATILNPGTYQFVASLDCWSTPAIYIEWRRGLTNLGVSGDVLIPGLQDYDNDGIWGDNQNALSTLILDGRILLPDDPLQPITNDTTNKTLVDTTKTTTTEADKNLAYSIFIVGLFFMILGFIFMALGAKVHFVFTILGLIFIVIGLMMMAWASFILLAGIKRRLTSSHKTKKRKTRYTAAAGPRRFNGKVWKYYFTYSKKSEANRAANNLRKGNAHGKISGQRHNARVVRTAKQRYYGRRWAVYSQRRKR